METTASELTSDLAAARARLLAAIAGVSEEQFKRRPPRRDGEDPPWSIAEVLAHLLATSRIWAERVELALDRDGAPVTPTDPAAQAEQTRAGRTAPVPQLIHGLLANERQFRRLIERAGRENGLDRAIEHPRHGRLSVAAMLRRYAIDHEVEHATQIEALRTAVAAAPAGGPA
jgi:uncharacterized damage-inducible protein DinB